MRKRYCVLKNYLMMRIVIFSLFMVFTSAGMAFAQSVVKGKVVDAAGESMIGVTVMIKGTSVGTATDMDGNYTLGIPENLRAKKNNVMLFSFLGYKTQEVLLKGQEVIDIKLQEDVANLDEVVVVGYGTQRRASVTGSVSQVKGDELLRAPVGNLTNKLGGLITGVVTYQSSGQPGSDGSSLMIRGAGGKELAIIVDGVKRDISEIDPNEIASVSVLKDASSAAIYGLNANAVVIVTTKKGRVAPSKISFSGSYGVSQNAVMLEMLDGPGYAYWYNKAREMDGDAPVFSAEHVRMMTNGDDSDGWGNTDWYDKTFGLGHNYDYNVNATGGSENIQYFASIGNYNQTGNVDGFNYNRFNMRSNIDAKIAKNLDFSLGISGRLEKRESPFFSANPADWNNVPQQAMRAHPYVPEMYDGLPVATKTASSWVNPMAASDQSGYNDIKKTIVETNFSLTYNVPFVKGLSVKFMGAYDVAYQMSKVYSTPYYVQVAMRPGSVSGDISYAKSLDPRNVGVNNISEGYTLSEGTSHYEHITTNTSIRYENVFGKHGITFMALFETIQRDGNLMSASGTGFEVPELDELFFATMQSKNTVNGSSYQERNVGIATRLNYNYDQRLFAELAFRYDGSYLFGGMYPGNRWTPLPSASVGWRISEEKWFKNAIDFVDNLKLRGSIGLTSTSSVPPYQDLNTFSFMTNGSGTRVPAGVIGGNVVGGLLTSRPADFSLTWAKAIQYNFGFDASLWNGLLGVEFDVFYKYQYDMLSQVAAAYPDSYGGFYHSYENKNKQDHKGFEIQLSHNNRIGDFSYRVAVNGTYAKQRWLRFTDSENTPDWMKLTGKEVGAQMGFIADGIFQTQEEIDNAPKIEGTSRPLRPGDIRYVDRNGDGVISYEQDRGYIGKNANPQFVGGFTFNGSWKGIDLSFMLQAGLGRDVALTGVYDGGIMDNTAMTKAFYHDGNSPVYLVKNSWTEDNRNAKFPRLSIDGCNNNAYSSTYWYRNGDYLRLKNLQLGYSFPTRWLKNVGMSQLRVYVEGSNLLTFSGLEKYNIDPEQPNVSNGYYPQQRTFSAGVNLSF